MHNIKILVLLCVQFAFKLCIHWFSLLTCNGSLCSWEATAHAQHRPTFTLDAPVPRDGMKSSEIVRKRERGWTRQTNHSLKRKGQWRQNRINTYQYNAEVHVQEQYYIRCSRFAKTQNKWAVSSIVFPAMHRDLLKWYIDAWCVRWNKAQSKHMETLSMAITANISLMNDRMRTKPSRHLTENS